MKFKKITIKNFRCYTFSEMNLGESCTVFIGKNGTGKSSVLSAIRKGISFAFSNDVKKLNENKIDSTEIEVNPLRANNNSRISTFSQLDTHYDYNENSFKWPVSISYDAELLNTSIKWEFYKKGHPGGLHPTKYKEALGILLNLLTKNENSWPLFSFYSDSFPHSAINILETSNILLNKVILPIDYAYYSWDLHSNCTLIWIKRLNIIDKEINTFYKEVFREASKNVNDFLFNDQEQKEAALFSEVASLKEEKYKSLNNKIFKHYEREFDYISSKFRLFTQPLEREKSFINENFSILYLSLEPKISDEEQLWFLFNSGEKKALDMLPMGYKRLFEIVLDLAYRSFILTKGEYEATGIALIDEIELHLHPTLQQEVLSRFRRTFPQIQFIVTTHSPLVISNFKSDDNNRIIKLENDGERYWNEELENIYGLDYATNLNEVMEVAPRASTIDKYINGYLFLYGKGKEEEANKLLEQLKEYVGGSISPFLQAEIDKKRKQYER